MEIRLDRVYASEDGDYFQVLFETNQDDGPYVLIQRQFEDDGGERCYIETHQEEYIGHTWIRHAVLTRDRFVADLARAEHAHIRVTFTTTNEDFADLLRVLKIIIPKLKVRLDEAG